MPTVDDFCRHSAYSNPGRHAALIDAVPTDLSELSAVARNLIVHYKSSTITLPASTRDDIHLRWLSAILDTDQERHPVPLAEPREAATRVQGCCRDQSLFSVGVLRQHGIAARIRVGFASYFVPNFHVGHVVVETSQGGRWLRFDPEIEAPTAALDSPRDIPAGPDAPFRTAAEVWQGYRADRIDSDRCAADPGSEFGGPWFIQNCVLMELAHRYGDELLRWDGWGAMRRPDTSDPAADALADEVSALLIAADNGDDGAETDLAERYAADTRLRPGDRVIRNSPYGEPPIEVALRA